METPIVERYMDKQVIITEGIMSQKAYIVMSGEVAISKKVGARTVTIGILQKGDIFGEMGLFQETVRSATATARGDVALGIIDRARFKQLYEECPADMKIIIDSLVDRFRLVTEKLATIAVKLQETKKVLDAYTIKENSD
jgi:CRP/FNR family cyclic AMP-dependent transcriptional regulator